MKKIILVALAAIVSTGAFAQKFEWGVKAGLSLGSITKADNMIFDITEMDLDVKESGKMRTGFVGGLFGEYIINDFFGVQAELLYSMQGKKNEISEAGETFSMTLKADYINLPILAKFYILEGLSVEVGPQFGYMLSLKGKLGLSSGLVDIIAEEFGEEVKDGYEEDLYKDNDDLKKFDVSVGLGLSYKFNFGLDVFGRYNLGLTKVSEGVDYKNSVIQVGVGYRF